MAKRGRKPSGKKKGYFFEEQEQAVIDYINETDAKKRNEIYNKTLYPAFCKMVESIINRYKLYPPDEEFKDTFDDTISFLMTKIDRFDPSKGYKSYSYCGTICKNYLIYKINQFDKNKKRNDYYEETNTNFTDNIEFSYDESSPQISFLSELISGVSEQIQTILNDKKKFRLSENEIKVGNALIELMNNWEELFVQMGSNKFNKSSILMFLRETTLLSTKDIRDAMKHYKLAYYKVKKKLLEDS